VIELGSRSDSDSQYFVYILGGPLLGNPFGFICGVGCVFLGVIC